MRFLDTSGIRTRFNESVLASDGTTLSVDLYFPPKRGCYPVLLNRTPADNNRNGRVGISDAPAERWKKLAALGFIVAAADVRGRGDSDGDFIPFRHEAEDGAATLAWLRNLEESSGKVGLFGTGYGAFCAWAAACADKLLNNQKVDAIVSASPFGAVGEGLLHNNGAVRLDWLFWMHLVGGRTVQPANVPDWKTIFSRLPLNTMEQTLGRSDIWWQDWLNRQDPAHAYWQPLNLAEQVAGLDIPALHISGWWDGQLNAARYYYRAAAQSQAAQQLLIGPWDTAGVRRPSLTTGGVNFGPRSVLDMDEELTKFFRAYLQTGSAPKLPASRIFITGRNEWVESVGWPATGTEEKEKFYMSSNWGANTCRGDGQLLVVPDRNLAVDAVTHNPEVPVTFQPDFISFASGANPVGFTLEQAQITARDEALVYTSEPLQRTLTVSGQPRVKFKVKINAPDADLFVLVSDNFPGGASDLHLAHGVQRLAAFKGFEQDKWVEVNIILNDICHDFLVGHHIRVTLTPSLFPLYAINPHASDYARGQNFQIARIEVSLENSFLEFRVGETGSQTS